MVERHGFTSCSKFAFVNLLTVSSLRFDMGFAGHGRWCFWRFNSECDVIQMSFNLSFTFLEGLERLRSFLPPSLHPHFINTLGDMDKDINRE